MALSNRDRIDRMFGLLAEPLDDFVTRVVASELTTDTDWSALVRLRDEHKGIRNKQYDRRDPSLALRMLTETITHQVKPGWYPFRDFLSRAQESLATELRDVRNTWAHHGSSFSADDTYRALDTGERLLRAIDASEAADEVEKLRKDLRRVTSEADDRRVVKASAVQSGSEGLKPWREVVAPHEDVASGNFQAAEFAADLYKVSTGDPDTAKDYADPVEFFARTYLTDGLRDLIDRAWRRLDGDENASPVVNLQTNFGGGKTHSMLALWHLGAQRATRAYPDEVERLLVSATGTDGLLGKGLRISRVALVGNHLAPSGDTKGDGTRVRTLWGELAWQLGGADAYAMVAESDRTATAPGPALHELLAAYAPAVILVDEWVAYARQLYDREDLAGGTFGTQFGFAQALTEAVKGTPGVFLAISIPASHDSGEVQATGSDEEVGGANGREALRQLQNVVRRVADQWQPASSQEAYEIVRRRLFVEPDAEGLAAIGVTAKAFVELYRRHSTEFPREARENDYEERIRRSYPVHPELFGRLYEDWSTLERFQRTRGVLRLMNTIIHELWVAGDTSPLIMPGSVPLAASKVNTELTQYLSDSWKAIIDADVDGPQSVPADVDKQPVFGRRSLTRRLARTVFFGAAPTIHSAHKGLELARVFVGTAVPGDTPGNFHSALNQLGDRATYFYSGAGKYWYDTQANITRRAKDQAESLHDEDVWAEIVRRLEQQQGHRGGFAAVQVAQDSADIPDQDAARLVLIHPRAGYSRRSKTESPAAQLAKAATERRGSSQRQHRNMVVFLAGDSDRLDELASAVRAYLGWDHVCRNADELDLTAAQRRQAEERRDRENRTAADRLLGTYHWALVPEGAPGEPFTVGAVKADGQSDWLAERVTLKLHNDSRLDDQHAARLIRMQLDRPETRLWREGRISVGELWLLYTTYPYMPRLRDRSVLEAGVRSMRDVLVWETDAFAVAESYDESADHFTGLVLPVDQGSIGVHDGLLLVEPSLAHAQRERELIERGGRRGGHASGPGFGGPGSGPAQPAASPVAAGPEPKRRFFGTRSLGRDTYAADFRKVVDEVVQPLAAVEGVELEVRLEITAVAPAGFDDAKIRTVGENARTLRFEQSGFEED